MSTASYSGLSFSMTSREKDLKPSSISALEGETGEKGNTPYIETENKSDDLEEEMDHPQLTNPGSMESILTSDESETASKLRDSVINYLKAQPKPTKPFMLFILGLIQLDNKISPAIFNQDLVRLQGDDKFYIGGYRRLQDLIREFLQRKKEFASGVYEERCLGFYHCVYNLESNLDMPVAPWPFMGDLKVPHLILKRRQ